jgi:NAD+ dependent glucose-6-phosphate dehydrogenase
MSERGGGSSRRVLITGADGTIGTAVREHLGDRYELVGLTLEPQDFPGHVGDISDFDAVRPAFDGMDAVVHLAASPSIEAPWEDVLPNNLVGTYNVFEAARQAGASRVVFASSSHAVGMAEVVRVFCLRIGAVQPHDDPTRPLGTRCSTSTRRGGGSGCAPCGSAAATARR